MKTKLFTLFTALCCVCVVYASNVITYTAFAKLSETTDYYSSGLHTNAFNVSISSHEFADGQGTITFAGEVTSIGDYAFNDCSGLTSVTIPNSVTSIGYDAFRNCSGLTSIEIPNSVTSIGNHAFSGCSGLTSITIPNSVTSIGNCAFEFCSGLTSVTIPNSVTSIGDWAFYNCTGLTSPVYIANCFAYMPTTYEGSYTIPDGIKQIAGGAFEDCSGLTSVTIPNSVTSIGNKAFYGCSGLTSVTIPNSVTSIGSHAFYDCSGLTSVTIPNSVTEIGYDAFRNCSGLTSIEIPNSVTSIGYEAFQGCSGLTSVTIPNSVTSISDWAFKGCTGLTSITIPNSVTKIGNSAFLGCSGLTSVTIPNSVTSIGSNAFYECSGLTSVTIPNSVTKIGNSAFLGCSGLTSVTIPNSVTSIGSNAFYECSGLTSVTIPNNVTSIGGYAFDGVDSICISNADVMGCPWGAKHITISDTLKSKRWELYRDDSTLVVLGGNTESIMQPLDNYVDYIKHVVVQENVSLSISDRKNLEGSITVQQALDIIAALPPAAQTDVEYTLQGQVVMNAADIPNYSHITFTLADATGSINCRYIKYLNNADFTSVYQVPTLGSKVAVIGTLRAYAKDGKITPEMWNGYFLSIEAATIEEITVAEAIELALALPAKSGSAKQYRCSGVVAEVMTKAADVPGKYTNINFKLANGIDTINCYYTNYLGIKAFSSADQIPAVGTKVTIVGPLRNFVKDNVSTPEFQNAYFEAIGDTVITQDAPAPVNKVIKDKRILNSITWNAINSMQRFPFECYWDVTSVPKVTFGEKVESIPDSLCNGMSGMKQILSHATNPPACGEHTFDSINRNTPVCVPTNSLNLYKQAPVWREFYNIIDTIASEKPIETDTVKVEATETTASLAWPAVESAYSYTLIILANAEQTEKVCTLTFNSNGQLTGIDFSKAPSKTPNETNPDLSFTVTGLQPGTTYGFTLSALNENGAVLDTKTGTFTTAGTSAVGTVAISGLYAENGRIVCENAQDMHIYTLTGIDVTHENGHLLGVYIVKCGEQATKVVVR